MGLCSSKADGAVEHPTTTHRETQLDDQTHTDMPSVETVNHMLENLMDELAIPQASRNGLRGQSLEMKWQMIKAHESRKDEGKEECTSHSPNDYIDQLKQFIQNPAGARKFASLFKAQLRTCQKAWLDEFIEQDGLDVLKDFLLEYAKDSRITVTTLEGIKSAIKVYSTLQSVSTHEGIVGAIAIAFLSPAKEQMKRVLELLTVIAVSSEEGHEMVDAGIYHLSKEAGDNHKFGCLVEAVRDPKIAWELKSMIITFFNALLATDDLDERCEIRNELIRGDLLSALAETQESVLQQLEYLEDDENWDSSSVDRFYLKLLKNNIEAFFKNQAKDDLENQICGVNIGNTKSLFEKAQDSASKSGSSKIFLRIMRLLAVIPTAFSLSHTVWEEVERAIAETVLPNEERGAKKENVSLIIELDNELGDMKKERDEQKEHLLTLRRQTTELQSNQPKQLQQRNIELVSIQSTINGMSKSNISTSKEKLDAFTQDVATQAQPEKKNVGTLAQLLPPGSETQLGTSKRSEQITQPQGVDQHINADQCSTGSFAAINARPRPQLGAVRASAPVPRPGVQSNEKPPRPQPGAGSARASAPVPRPGGQGSSQLPRPQPGAGSARASAPVPRPGGQGNSQPPRPQPGSARPGAPVPRPGYQGNGQPPRPQPGSVRASAPVPRPGGQGNARPQPGSARASAPVPRPGGQGNGLPPRPQPGSSRASAPVGRPRPVRPPAPQNQGSEKNEDPNAKPVIKPGVKTRGIFWSKLTKKKVDNTIWEQIEEDNADVDIQELEELFRADAKEKNAKSTAHPQNESKPKRKEAEHVLDSKTQQNVGIALARLRLTPLELRQAVFEGDEEVLTEERLSVLQSLKPTAEIRETLDAFTGDKSKIGKVDKFFFTVKEIPLYEEKLKTLHFKKRFPTLVEGLDKKTDTLVAAVKCIRESRGLKRILEYMLKIGNYLNGNTSRGQAHGFKVDALRKASTMRSVDPNTTLVDYLARVALRNNESSIQDLPQELIPLKSIEEISFEELNNDLKEIQRNAAVVSTLLSKASKDERESYAISEQFAERIEEFSKLIGEQLSRLEDKLEETKEKFCKLVELFGDSPNKMEVEEFFKNFKDFRHEFEMSLKKEKERDLKSEKGKQEKDKSGSPETKRVPRPAGGKPCVPSSADGGSVEIGDKAEGSPSSVTSPRGMHRRGKNSRQGTLTLRRGEGLSSVKEKENRPPVHENQKAA